MTTMDILPNHRPKLKTESCVPRALFLMLTLSLIPHGLFSGEDTPQAKTFQYNQKLTDQLEVILNCINDLTYPQQRREIQRLICAGADPNVHEKPDSSLLYKATMKDDIEVVRCCLERGAKINQAGLYKPVKAACSVAVLQCLVDYNVDLHYKKGDGETLLHTAATYGRSPEIMAFLCNSGLSPNEKSILLFTPLHHLFYMFPHYQRSMENAALFSWYRADFYTKNIHGKSPFEDAKRLHPELVPKVQALGVVVPLVKAQHNKEYNNMLATHITAGPASIVMTYVEPSWGQHAWKHISDGIAQQTGSPSEPIQKTESCMIPAKTQKSSWCNVS